MTYTLRTLCFAFALGPVLASAQSVFFHFTDGTVHSYALADIRKLTFEGDEQILWLSNGAQYTWNVSTIGQYEFQEGTGIEHIASGQEPLQLNLYPNPAGALVTVETELPQGVRLMVDILDVNGRLVRGLYAGERPSGLFRLPWDVANVLGERVVSGTYLVRLRTPWGSSTKPLLVQ